MAEANSFMVLKNGKNKTKSLMKVIVVATGNFNQKTSYVIPQLPLDYCPYIVKINFNCQYIVKINLSGVAEELWVEHCP